MDVKSSDLIDPQTGELPRGAASGLDPAYSGSAKDSAPRSLHRGANSEATDLDEPPGSLLYGCDAIGCAHRGPLPSIRSSQRGRQIYCLDCAAAEHAALLSFVPQAAIVEALATLRASPDAWMYPPPFPDAIACIGCPSWARQAARPGMLTCSVKCQRRASLVHRTLRIVCRNGLRLPEAVWRVLLGLTTGAYGMRRRALGVEAALSFPLDRTRSRAAKARHAALVVFEDEPDVRARIIQLGGAMRTR